MKPHSNALGVRCPLVIASIVTLFHNAACTGITLRKIRVFWRMML